MDRALINSVILMFLSAILAYIATLHWHRKKSAVDEALKISLASSRLTERVMELEKQLSLVNQAVLPISTAFQAILIKELTHFHTPIMDALMVKLGPPNILTGEEEKELIEALKERAKAVDSLISDTERDAATILPIVMKRAKLEESLTKQQVQNTELKVVTATPLEVNSKNK